MLYLAIIGIVCAVSAPKDGIPQIGEKNFKSNSHYQFDEGDQTSIEQVLPRLRNGTSVCYSKSAYANDSNRTSSNFYDYLKNQCSLNKKNSSYSLVENLETKKISQSFSSFKKRNILWFEKNNREKMKRSHSSLLLNPDENQEAVKLRKKNGQIYAKRKTKRRSLDKIKVDDEVDIRKQIQKLVKKIAANNMLRQENSHVNVQENVEEKQEKSLNSFQSKNLKKKNINNEGRGGTIRIKVFPEAESVVVKFGNRNDDTNVIMPTCSYSAKSMRKARLRRNPKKIAMKSAEDGCGFKKIHNYRNFMSRVADNNFPLENFDLNKINYNFEWKPRYKNRYFRKRLASIKKNLKKRSCLKQTKDGSTDDTDYKKKIKELLDENDDNPEGEIPKTTNKYLDEEDKNKKKDDKKKEGTVFQKPFLGSTKKKTEKKVSLREDYSLIPSSATKSKLLTNNKNLTPERYLKIRHALRSYLIENDAWGHTQRDSFIEKRKRFKKGCSMPHKCWRAAPLLCIPYIRKGQDEMLKYIIKNLQKMLGKPFTRKIDIFEKTKFKPLNPKTPNENSDDIIPGDNNEEECTTKNPCCSTTVCVPSTCPPTTTCATTTTTCRTTSTCSITPSTEVTCGKGGFTFPITTTPRNSVQETTLAPSATLPAPPLSATTKSFMNANTKTLPIYNTPRFSPRPIPLMTTPMSRTIAAVSLRLNQFATTARALRVPNQPLLNTPRAVSFACADSCPFDFSKAPIRQDEYYLFDPMTEEDIEPSKNPLESLDPQQNLMNHFKNQNGFKTTPQWLHRLLNPVAFKQSISYEDKEADKFKPTPDLDNQIMQGIQNQPYFSSNSFRPRIQKNDMNQWMMQMKRPQQESTKYNFQPIMEFFPAYDYDVMDKFPYMKYNMGYNRYRYPWMFHKNYGMKIKSPIGNGKNSRNQELKRQKRSYDWVPPPDKEDEYDYDFKDNDDYVEGPQDMNPNFKFNWKKFNIFRKSGTTPAMFEMFSNLAMEIVDTEANTTVSQGISESKKSTSGSKKSKTSGGKTSKTTDTATKKYKSKTDESTKSGTSTTTVTESKETTTTVTESKETTTTTESKETTTVTESKGTEEKVTLSETTATEKKTVSPSTLITTNNASTIATTNASYIESTTASTTTTLTTMTKPSTARVNFTTLHGLTKSNATTSLDENKSTDIYLKSKSMPDSNTTEPTNFTIYVKSTGSNKTSSNISSTETSTSTLSSTLSISTTLSTIIASSTGNTTTNESITTNIFTTTVSSSITNTFNTTISLSTANITNTISSESSVSITSSKMSSGSTITPISNISSESSITSSSNISSESTSLSSPKISSETPIISSPKISSEGPSISTSKISSESPSISSSKLSSEGTSISSLKISSESTSISSPKISSEGPIISSSKLSSEGPSISSSKLSTEGTSISSSKLSSEGTSSPSSTISLNTSIPSITISSESTKTPESTVESKSTPTPPTLYTLKTTLNITTTENPLKITNLSSISKDTNTPTTKNTTISLTTIKTTCIAVETSKAPETARTSKNKKKSKASGTSHISSSQCTKMSTTTTESTTPNEDEDMECLQDSNKKEEGFVATTLKAASIVKGPKLMLTKPAPRMFAKVYPETYPNSAKNNENTPNDMGQTTVAPLKSILEKALLQPTTVAPDVRLQLLPVCEGYLEVVKLIKAQNQSLAAELDSELSQFCENIISQSFNLPEGNFPKKTSDTYPYAINGTYPVELQMPKELNDEFTTRDFHKKVTSNLSSKKEPETSTRKKFGRKKIDEILKDYADKEEKKKFNLMKQNYTENNQKRIRRKNEISIKEMSQKHKKTLDLLKKRKRELLKWLMNSQEDQEDGVYPEETEYAGDEEFTRTTMQEVSGKINHNGDQETTIPTAVSPSKKNRVTYPVYAKKYGYDKGGELREVEVLWRKINQDTQEKKLLKTESVLAFLLTPTISPFINPNQDKSESEDEDIYEGQSNRERNVFFADRYVSLGIPIFPNYTTEFDTNSTISFNETAATSAPNSTVTVHHNVTFLNPNMTKKIIKKVEEAKGKLQEYGIEFLNYAVYILPIMFSLLFLICCTCWFFDLWRRKKRSKRKKRKAKKEISMTETESSGESEAQKKKRRKRVQKEVEEDGSEGTKKYRRFWNPLKYQKADYNDENTPLDNKFLRFLKMKKDREMEIHSKSEGRRNRNRETERNRDFDVQRDRDRERSPERDRKKNEEKSRSQSREGDSDNRDRNRDREKYSSNKPLKKKEFAKADDEQSEGTDRREIIALLDELKDIEMQQLEEKYEKPMVVGYMEKYERQKSDFDYSNFPVSYPQGKYFPTGRSPTPFCEKHFNLLSREGSPTFENYEVNNDIDELEELLPCKCNRYAIKNDFVRRPQYRISKPGNCENFFRTLRNSCIPEKNFFLKKEMSLFKDKNLYLNKYKSVSTETSDELLLRKEYDPKKAEFSFTDNLLEELIPRKTIGLMSETERLQRQFSKKKCIRLKEGGVLCRL